MRRGHGMEVVHLAQLVGERLFGGDVPDAPSRHRVGLAHRRYRYGAVTGWRKRSDGNVPVPFPHQVLIGLVAEGEEVMIGREGCDSLQFRTRENFTRRVAGDCRGGWR